jgi:hypothetical protein
LGTDVAGVVLRTDICRCVRRKAIKTVCQLMGADRLGTAVLYTRGRGMAVLAFPWSTPAPKGVGVDATPASLYPVSIVYEGNSISKLQIQVATYFFELSAGNCHR